jgi:uncharacterized protein
MLLEALGEGKLCVVDVSQLRGGPALILSGLILRRIFDHNQEQFTKAEPKTIPTIAVVEEAQSVLSSQSSGSDPYVAWVKEGRKYDLGAVLITQQPGSIPNELLSQGDNWFVFHLLSSGDLQNVKKANAHFSDDLLSALLNEPIEGQGVFWSSVGGKPYPLSVRILSFEGIYGNKKDNYQAPGIDTYAVRLRRKYDERLAEAQGRAALIVAADAPAPARVDGAPAPSLFDGVDDGEAAVAPAAGGGRVDALRAYKDHAVRALRANPEFQKSINTERGIPWGVVMGMLEKALPDSMENRNEVARGMVDEAVAAIVGTKGAAWETVRRDTAAKKNMLFIVRKKA